MIIRAEITVREGYDWGTSAGESDRERFRHKLEGRIFNAVGELAAAHGVRVREIRFVEGRPKPKTNNGVEQ